MVETHIYTVSELTSSIRSILEDNFQNVWVEGEVSNLVVSSSGHVYFSLKDEKSLLNCVLFKGSALGVKFSIEPGLSVICCGKISVYDKRGQYQLYVNKMEPFGKGALQLAFEQLKIKLYNEKLFDQAHKRPLPLLPTCLGIITSATGAVVRDILKVARRRFSNIEVLIRPVRVQGDQAKFDIVQAIEEFNEFNQYVDKTNKGHTVDVIIIARGGGSLEDLWPFNEEMVARAIYASTIPIVSAVGHEVDYTIADLVADFRAATPSVAAEMVVPVKEDLMLRISERRERLYMSLVAKIAALEMAVKALKDSYVLRNPMNPFLQLDQEVDEFFKAAVLGITRLVDLRKRDLSALTGRLKALSPLAILERGYSITFKCGKVVKAAGLLASGDEIMTRLAKGSIISRVVEGNV